jgi:hypothetical protein
MVGALCIYVGKVNDKTCWACSKKAGEVMRKNDEGVNIIIMHCKHMCKCHSEYPLELICANKNVRKREYLEINYKN